MNYIAYELYIVALEMIKTALLLDANGVSEKVCIVRGLSTQAAEPT